MQRGGGHVSSWITRLLKRATQVLFPRALLVDWITHGLAFVSGLGITIRGVPLYIIRMNAYALGVTMIYVYTLLDIHKVRSANGEIHA